MKKNILFTGAFAFILSTLLLTGCKKDDTTSPVVTPNGTSPMTVTLNGTFTDPGATGNDDEDGAITSVSSDASSTNPNVNLTGTYTVTYSATDAAGNTGSATLTVIVKNSADYLAGTYLTSEDGFVTSWTQTVTASTTVNNRIVFSRFADYSNNNAIYATVTGAEVALPTSQVATGIGLSGCTHTFTPSGTPTVPVALVSGKYNFSVKFTDEQDLGGVGCAATSPVLYEDVFHQQ